MQNSPVPSRRRRALAGTAVVAVAAAAFAIVPAGSAFAADTTAPVLSVAQLTPVSPIPAYTSIISNTTWAPSTATGLRDWFTNGLATLNLSATDDTDVAKFTVKIGNAGVPFDVPAVGSGTTRTASYDFTGDQTNTITYTAVDSAGNASAPRTVAVKLDSTPPSVTFPGITDFTVPHSKTAADIKPTKTDAIPGSGGAAIREMWVDGKKVDVVPFEPASLSVGGHTWALLMGDAAGNQSKVTLTFTVTTSFADVETLIQRYVTAGSISTANGAILSDLLQDAKDFADADNDASAVSAIDAFAASAKQLAPKGIQRSVLVGDAAALKNEILGVTPAAVATGITAEAAPAAPRMPQVYAGGSVVNANPDFKVLLFSNRVGGFRHQHIPATMKFIQAAGAAQNFDVDIWDYMAPTESVPGNPFESIENLRQYDAVVGVSSVGNSQFITNRPTFSTTDDPAAVVDEQAILKQYVNEGGGFVAIHGATDSMHNWQWYKDLTGGEFQNHGSSTNGSQHNCEACKTTEVLTEDGTNPSTEHFPRSYRVLDELYNWVGLPRLTTHVLQTLTESTYTGGLNAGDGTLEGPDHPISWCQNFDGGRAYTQALLHNFELSDDPIFQKNIVEAIKWSAGETEANCVTHNEITKLIAADLTAGKVTTSAAAKFNAAVTASFNAYNFPTRDYVTAEAQANVVLQLAQNPSNGSAAELAVLEAKAVELVEWMALLQDTSTTLRFTSQPASASTGVGSSVVFSAEAKGTDVTYQWQKKAGSTWADIAGATSFALTVTPTSISEDGTQYRVQIGDASNDINSSVATLDVVLGASTVSVPATATQIVGATSLLTVTVGAGNSVVPTGTVTVSEGGTTVVSGALVGGTSTLTLPASLSAGSHALTVSYSGDGNLAASAASVALVVTKGASSTTSAPASVSSTYGSSASVAVTVTGANAIIATGTVSVKEGGVVIVTAPLVAGRAAIALPATLGAGAHALVVEYSGDANLLGSSAAVAADIAKVATTTKVKVAGKASVKKGKAKSITITVTAAGGAPTGTVAIYDGSKKIASKSLKNGKVSYSFSSSKTGTHKLSAKYLGSANTKASTSKKVNLKVVK